jgi:hypothetical protein
VVAEEVVDICLLGWAESRGGAASIDAVSGANLPASWARAATGSCKQKATAIKLFDMMVIERVLSIFIIRHLFLSVSPILVTRLLLERR